MAKMSMSKMNPDRFDKSQIKFYLFIIPFAIFMMLPIVFIFFHAFKPVDELFAYPPKFITTRPVFDNFKKLFATASQSNQPVTLYIFNSLVSTTAVIFSTIMISVAAAYVLSKKKFRGRELIFKINTLSMMFVSVAVMIPRFLIIKHLGLLDNFFAHIIPMLAMPVGLFLIKQFLDTFPDSLTEAAAIDGASDYYILWKIIMPIIMPAVSAVSILSFQSSWNSVEASSMFINQENLKNFAFYMSTLSASTGNSVAGHGMSAASTLIMFLPNLAFFILLQSKVMNTMAHSGIK